MELLQHETIANMFRDLGIEAPVESISLSRLAAVDSRFIRDLKLNISSALGSSNLNRKEAYLLALSVAVNEKHQVLMQAFEKLARNEGAGDAEIAETHACTILMSTNNVFYRFRHFMDGVEYYNNQPAGLRMSIMMNPVLGKEFFELMSLVISAVNGCERCVTSHENSVKQHGAGEPRIYDAVRLGSVIRSLCIAL